VQFHPTMRQRIARADEEDYKRVAAFIDRLEENDVTYQIIKYGTSLRARMDNLWLSQCYSCKGFSVWVKDQIVYPVTDTAIIAHEEMPADVKADFDEAASIVDKSPRGATALLRLAEANSGARWKRREYQ
jgi:hypothetical protein